MDSKNASVLRHCAELDRCNQRGGRMLSILDLLDAQTLDLDLAAYLMARITRGASFLVGALPGGAGKTTIMCALLNLIPPDLDIVAATPDAVAKAGARTAGPPACFVCHEIGAGSYFAYLWDADLRAYFALLEGGHVLATNLHADDFDEAHAQICAENRVPEHHFNAAELLLFLRVKHGPSGTRHLIDKVYSSEGQDGHRLIFDTDSGLAVPPDVDGGAWRERCGDFLEELQQTPERTIQEMRGHVAGFIETPG